MNHFIFFGIINLLSIIINLLYFKKNSPTIDTVSMKNINNQAQILFHYSQEVGHVLCGSKWNYYIETEYQFIRRLGNVERLERNEMFGI
jgi:hypothetical protein